MNQYANPRRATPNKGRFALKRALLPKPLDYYTNTANLKLIGGGEWRSAICPFHDDKSPSLRVNLVRGGYRCMVCDAHGGDVIAFHQAITGLRFIEACKALGAWDEGAKI